MKVCIHDTLSQPGDWRSIDSADWLAQPARPQPTGGEIVDNRRGWIHKVCIQGIGSTGDHHAVRHLPGGCELTSWSDDPYDPQDHPDWRPDEPPELWFRAHVIRFRELAPNEALGGAITPQTTRVLYAGQRVRDAWLSNSPNGYRDLIIRPWEEFSPPALDLIRHGIWVPDDLHAAHEAAQSPQDWRAWGDHLDPAELDENGLVRPQHSLNRMARPKGTITYFLRDTDQASGAHATAVAANENQMITTAGAGETEPSSTLAAGEDNLEFLWSTIANNPNDADWPSGDYECQTDCSAIDADVSYGLLTLGGSAGHFANVDSGLTADNESWTQDEGAFTVATLNLATSTIDPASGAAGDRFECLVAGARAAGCHGNQTFTMRYNSDAFGRGPWTAAAAAPAFSPALFKRMKPTQRARE